MESLNQQPEAPAVPRPHPSPVPEEVIDAALAADIEWMRISRSVVFRSCSRDQVRMMLEAAEPLMRQAWLSTAAPGGEIVRQAWVYWALEQSDVAEHPNWVKSWAELDERDREADDRIYSVVAEIVRAKVRGQFGRALREHYLAGISCDHARKEDNPVCACSRVFLGWHPSVGEAVEAWIGHVMEVAGSEGEAPRA
jgi:hypothetical protein